MRRFLVTALAPLLLGAPAPAADPPAAAPSTPPPAAVEKPPAPSDDGAPKATPQEIAQRKPEAQKLFGKLDDDRAIVWIAAGAPDARQEVTCADLFRPLEVWTYLEHPTFGRNSRILFFQESGTKVYRFWTLLEGEPSLRAASSKKALEELDPEKLEGQTCPQTALVLAAYRDTAKRQMDVTGGLLERSRLDAARQRIFTLSTQPAPPVLVSNKPLSGKERRAFLEKLPEKYKKFLADVEPIMAELERDTFLRITTEYQRERFIEDFWKRRSINPKDGVAEPFREIYELRLTQAKERFGKTTSDQGRIFLVNGPPDASKKINCEDVFYPIEIWYYERLESIRKSKVLLLFFQSYGVGDYKLWIPLDGTNALIVGGAGGLIGSSSTNRRVDIQRCFEWREVLGAINSINGQFGGAESLKLTSQIKEGAKPDVEGVDGLLQMTTDLAENATKLPLQRLIRFPELMANKMRMEVALMLERETLAKKMLGEEAFYDIDVVGEIVKGGRLIDNFRYRFDFPVSTVNGPFVPLTLEREIYPGEYQIRIKVADANQNAGAVIAEKLVVPDVADAALTEAEKAAREAARVAVAQLAASNEPKGAITLVPLAREFATGLIKFETRTYSNDIAYTEFYLNDSKVLADRRAPFEADLNMGTIPRRQRVKVIGYAKDGKPIAEDELVLNEGREAFRLRITSPDKGAVLSGATRVVSEVSVPETKRLRSVEIYVNDKRVAALYQAPFEQVVEIPRTKELGIIRVVAELDDGTSTEDLRYFNAPKYLSEVDVQAVELFVSVLDKGKPVTGLTQEAFHVLEDGIPQTVDGFEVMKNLPVNVGLAVDTSGSMEESMIEAQRAANEFLRDVMTPKDRAFLVSFDNEPQLVSRFTSDRDKLAQALAGLRAQGSTALWDALVYGLYQFQGIKGRKAYVILTDGEDRTSKFTYEAALDYARKSGAAIYIIGLRVGGAKLEVKYKLNKLAKDTGGSVYYVSSAGGLKAVYAEINEELRSQYLVTYVPQNKTPGGVFRKIEVKMTPDNLTARTISGYYP